MEKVNFFLHGDNKITFNEDTLFQIQVGKGDRGSYKNRYSFRGDFKKAAFYYGCINIGNGYKKRFLMDGKVLSRSLSY